MAIPRPPLATRLAAEALGTAFLLAIIVGSGITGQRLAGGNAALALLANSIATGCGLAAMIYVVAPISGAHFNPLVSILAALRKDFLWRDVVPYAAVQTVAAIAGVVVANLMFEEPLIAASTHARTGWAQWVSEGVATFGLMVTIFLVAARGQEKPAGGLAVAVGGYITAAYWFTSSTAFANPAVTIARSMSDTFAGIRPDDVPAFIVAQCAGLAIAAFALRSGGIASGTGNGA